MRTGAVRTNSWELAFTLLDKLDISMDISMDMLGISIHPS